MLILYKQGEKESSDNGTASSDAGATQAVYGSRHFGLLSERHKHLQFTRRGQITRRAADTGTSDIRLQLFLRQEY